MDAAIQTEGTLRPSLPGPEGQGGCYLYCVVPSSEEVCLGAIGIGDHEVSTFVSRGLGVLLHRCAAKPYQSKVREVVQGWALAHHQVVEAAWKRWGTVIPMAFDTIIVPGAEGAEENLRGWLEKEHEVLQGKLNALRGKAEYGFQVLWDPAIVARTVAKESQEVRCLTEELRSKPRGVAYMYQQKLERRLKQEMESRASQGFQELYAAVSRTSSQVQVEKAREAEEGRQMIVNLSCLAPVERYSDLEALADQVSQREGYFVRLVGPLPPYSFC